ncbi:type II toxin-antitoxin system Phd/YefM family antitoxin [unidentified bacterial endosymbiont]|uniref:type II toxin-antitoxin system Phd/YefM family antitoxin n=1 Tax=unidentified bacterial endosymbiont TaxID=2355 RepID=UPI0020A1854F|nr:type II toxin-antitoxin system prevent-host-death family antitoxin [unidentified bacterial endosymbiont]
MITTMDINYGYNYMTLQTTIGAGDFKTKCLKLLDVVADTRQPLIITKHGKAVAKLIPMPPPTELFGALAGSVLREEDIVSPLKNEWAASL